MEPSATSPAAAPPAPDHGVQFYHDDDFLVEVIARMVQSSLARGAGLILTATEAHREQLRAYCTCHDQSLEAALLAGQVVLLDAEATLERSMRAGRIDPQRFATVVRLPLERLLARHPAVWIYDDMVDLLWRSGQHEATLALEAEWNALTQDLAVDLLCGYHLDGLTDNQPSESFRGICQTQARSLSLDPADTHRARLEEACLQQQAAALNGAIKQRRRTQAALDQTNLELARANADLKRLLQVASHDLQEPLRRAGIHLDLVQEGQAGLDAFQLQHLNQAQDCLNTMRQRVAAMRSLAEVVEGAKRRDLFPAEAALRDAQAALAPRLQASGACIQAAPLPQVLGDQAQLTQVFIQVIDNALVHHGPQPPLIRISVHGHDDGFLFSVSDNGIGIPATERDAVFQLFARLERGSSSGHAGAGLTLVQKIVEGHGGRVWIEGAVDGGTTLRFSWPTAEPRPTT